MSKLILLSILLTVVYSWEDLKRLLLIVIRSKVRNKSIFYDLRLDQFVATMLMFAILPLSLMYFLASEATLTHKLAWMAAELLVISCLAYGLGIFVNRMRLLSYASGIEKISVVAYSVMGLMSPTVRWIDPWSIERKLIVKFTFLLSLPALAGLALRVANSHTDRELLPHLDLLINIMVGGLIINIAVEFLEKHFRSYRHAKLSTYLRIVLGLVIGLVLITNVK